ncbi:MAG: Trm112 family protein [Nitriliruptoraceae bacterium]
MALDQRLIDILVCPACRAGVQYKDRRKVIVCDGCSRQYPVREHIPIMLLDDDE